MNLDKRPAPSGSSVQGEGVPVEPNPLDLALIRDTKAALHAHAAADPADWAALAEGVAICLYDMAASTGEEMDWLTVLSRQNPASVARVLQTNLSAADAAREASRLMAQLPLAAAARLAEALCDAGLILDENEELLAGQSGLGEPNPDDGLPEALAESVLSRLYAGMLAGDKSEVKVRELSQAFANGRELAGQIALGLGRAHLNRSDPLAALMAFRMGLQMVPAELDLRAGTATALNDLTQYQEALTVLDAAPLSQKEGAFSLAFQNARALTGLAPEKGEEGAQRALAAARTAADLALSGSPDEQYAASQLLDALGQPAAAEVCLARAVAAAPERLDWCHKLAKLYKRLEAWESAEHCLRQVVALCVDQVPALLELAAIQRQLGKVDSALKAAAEAANLDPENPRTLEAWVISAHAAGQWVTTVQAGRTALALHPESAAVHSLVGQAHAQLGQDEEAIFHLRRATHTAAAAVDAAPHLALADYLEQRGLTSQLEQVLEQGVRTVGEPTAAPLYLLQGELLTRTGRFTEAQAAYRRSYQLGNRTNRLLTGWGRVLCQLGHHDQAVTRLQEAVAQADADAETFHTLAEALEKVGRLPEAVAAARQAVVLDPTDGPKLFHAGQLCLETGDHHGAVDLLQAASQRSATQAAVWKALAQAHQGVGEGESALQALAAAARLNPTDPHTRHQIGEICLQLGRYDTAIAALTEACQELPQEPLVRRSLARALEMVGWWAQAADEYQQVTQLMRDDPEPWVGLARTARQGNCLEKAADAIGRACKMAPRNPRVLLERGWVQLAMGHTADASKTWSNLVRVSDQPSLLIQAGEALAGIDELETAATAFGRAADLGPADAQVRRRLGDVCDVLGRPAQALAAYLAAAELEPKNSAHWSAVAQMHWKMDDQAGAAEAWGKALALDPADVAVMEQLAQAHLLTGDAAGALTMFERAASRAEQNQIPAGAMWREAARAALALGELEKAQSFLIAALRNSPDDPEAHSLSGALADRVGQPEQALEAYERAAQLAPDRRDYQLQLADALAGRGLEMDALEVRKTLVTSEDDDDAVTGMLERLSALYARAGRYGDAERTLRSAGQRKPLSDAARRQLASMILEQAEVADYQRRNGVPAPDRREQVQQAAEWLADGDTPQDRRDLARARLLLGGVQEAIASLNVYLASLGDVSLGDLNAQRALGVAYRTAGAHEASIKVLASAVRLGSADERTAVELAYTYLAAGKPSAALALLEWTVNHSKATPTALYVTALAAHGAGEMDKAHALIVSAVEQQPKVSAWHCALAGWLRQRNQPLEALNHAQKALEAAQSASADRQAEALAELARVESDLGHLQAAADHWEQALESVSDRPAWWQDLGRVLLRLERPDQALGCFLRSEQLAEEQHTSPDPALYVEWSNACLALGKADQAGRHAKRALALAPDHPGANVALGHWHAAADRWQDALASFQSALARTAGEAGVSAAEEAEYRYQTACAYRALGAVDQAVEELERAAMLDPTHGAALTLLGDIHLAAGDRDMARQAYQQAARILPPDPTYVLLLARFLHDEGQLDQAMDGLTKALAIRPTADLWLELARVYGQRGQGVEEMDAVEQAVMLEPANPRAHLALGLAHKQRKSYEKAMSAFERVTELDPENKQAYEQLSAVTAMSWTGRLRRKAKKG
jgi:tetratricopeptide (TPR) repeat protein